MGLGILPCEAPLKVTNHLARCRYARPWGQCFMTQRGQFRMAFDTIAMSVAPQRAETARFAL